MDQKHAMLYPDASAMPVDQRSSAAAAIGLPVEPPPTYDAATREATPAAHLGWQSHASDINYPTSSHYSPNMNHQQLPIIVEQANIPLPANQQQPQQSQQSCAQQQQPAGIPITSECEEANKPADSGDINALFVCLNCGRKL